MAAIWLLQRITTHCHINNESYMAPPAENNSLPHQQWKLYGSTSGSQLTATSTMEAIWLHSGKQLTATSTMAAIWLHQRITTHCHFNNGSHMAPPVDHNSLPLQQWKPYGSTSGSQLTATSTMEAIRLLQRITTHCHINNESYMAPPAENNSLPHQQWKLYGSTSGSQLTATSTMEAIWLHSGKQLTATSTMAAIWLHQRKTTHCHINNGSYTAPPADHNSLPHQQWQLYGSTSGSQLTATSTMEAIWLHSGKQLTATSTMAAIWLHQRKTTHCHINNGSYTAPPADHNSLPHQQWKLYGSTSGSQLTTTSTMEAIWLHSGKQLTATSTMAAIWLHQRKTTHCHINNGSYMAPPAENNSLPHQQWKLYGSTSGSQLTATSTMEAIWLHSGKQLTATSTMAAIWLHQRKTTHCHINNGSYTAPPADHNSLPHQQWKLYCSTSGSQLTATSTMEAIWLHSGKQLTATSTMAAIWLHQRKTTHCHINNGSYMAPPTENNSLPHQQWKLYGSTSGSQLTATSTMEAIWLHQRITTHYHINNGSYMAPQRKTTHCHINNGSYMAPPADHNSLPHQQWKLYGSTAENNSLPHQQWQLYGSTNGKQLTATSTMEAIRLHQRITTHCHINNGSYMAPPADHNSLPHQQWKLYGSTAENNSLPHQQWQLYGSTNGKQLTATSTMEAIWLHQRITTHCHINNGSYTAPPADHNSLPHQQWQLYGSTSGSQLTATSTMAAIWLHQRITTHCHINNGSHMAPPVDHNSLPLQQWKPYGSTSGSQLTATSTMEAIWLENNSLPHQQWKLYGSTSGSQLTATSTMKAIWLHQWITNCHINNESYMAPPAENNSLPHQQWKLYGSTAENNSLPHQQWQLYGSTNGKQLTATSTMKAIRLHQRITTHCHINNGSYMAPPADHNSLPHQQWQLYGSTSGSQLTATSTMEAIWLHQWITTHCHFNNGSHMAPPVDHNSLPLQQWKPYGSTSGSQLTATSTMEAIWLLQRITTHCHFNNESYMAPPAENNSLPHQQWKLYGSTSGSQLTATSTMAAIWLHQWITTHCHINNESYMAPPAENNSLPHQQWKLYGSTSGSQLTATSTMEAIWLHQRKTTHCHINNGSYMAPPVDHNSLPLQRRKLYGSTSGKQLTATSTMAAIWLHQWITTHCHINNGSYMAPPADHNSLPHQQWKLYGSTAENNSLQHQQWQLYGSTSGSQLTATSTMKAIWLHSGKQLTATSTMAAIWLHQRITTHCHINNGSYMAPPAENNSLPHQQWQLYGSTSGSQLTATSTTTAIWLHQRKTTHCHINNGSYMAPPADHNSLPHQQWKLYGSTSGKQLTATSTMEAIRLHQRKTTHCHINNGSYTAPPADHNSLPHQQWKLYGSTSGKQLIATSTMAAIWLHQWITTHCHFNNDSYMAPPAENNSLPHQQWQLYGSTSGSQLTATSTMKAIWLHQRKTTHCHINNGSYMAPPAENNSLPHQQWQLYGSISGKQLTATSTTTAIWLYQRKTTHCHINNGSYMAPPVDHNSLPLQ